MEMVPFILSCITCFAARLCTGNLPGGLCSYLGVTEWSDPVLRSSNLFKKKSSSLPRPLLLHDAVLDRSTKPQRRQIPLDRQASKPPSRRPYILCGSNKNTLKTTGTSPSRVTHQQQATDRGHAPLAPGSHQPPITRRRGDQIPGRSKRTHPRRSLVSPNIPAPPPAEFRKGSAEHV